MLRVAIFILFYVKHSTCDCVLHTEISDQQLEAKVKNDFYSKDYNYYDKMPNENGTIINIKYVLKSFKFDQQEEVFGIGTWMFVQWEDPRLQWNTSNYGGVDKVLLNSLNFWNPFSCLKNIGDLTGLGEYYYNTCQIFHTGVIMCVIPLFLETMCIAKLDDWPYDSQTCTIKFSYSERKKENVTFTFTGSGISAFDVEHGPGWDIVDYSTGENATGDVIYYLAFVVERRAKGLSAIILFPSLVAATMTVSSMFLDVRQPYRLSFLVLSLYAQFKILQAVSENVPRRGHTSPVILLYIRSSINVTLFSVLMTIILHSLTKKNWKCYTWIEFLNHFVLKSRARCLVLPKWQANNADSSSSHVEAWTDFASIANTACTILIIIVYISVYFIYMPKSLFVNK